MKKILFLTIFSFTICFSLFASPRIGLQLGFWTDFNSNNETYSLHGIEEKPSAIIPLYKNLELHFNIPFGIQYAPEKISTVFVQPDIGLQYNFQFAGGWAIRPMIFFGFYYAQISLSHMTDDISSFAGGINLEIAKRLSEDFELIISSCYCIADTIKPFEICLGVNYLFP